MTMCQRPGCGHPAAGRLGYLADAGVVVIDGFVDAPGGVAVLCDRHLSRLTPPRGWELDDQRVAQQTLFRFDATVVEVPESGSPPVATVTPIRRRKRDRRTADRSEAGQLPLDAEPRDGREPHESGGAADAAEAAPASTAHAVTDAGAEACPSRDELDARDARGPLDATSPLLARAFAQPRERAVRGGIGVLLGQRAAG